MNTLPLPPSVNFHFWQPCNMRCRGCFAVFADVKATVLPRGHLGHDDAVKVASLLGRRFDKVTFAGGEPTLAPWLADLVAAAKEGGATTMLVTNGTRLGAALLEQLAACLDWVTLSIDSQFPRVHEQLGRAVAGRAIAPEAYVALASEIRATGLRLKVNTVVSRHNTDEDMRTFITTLGPERWKIFQVLPVGGQNDREFDGLEISRAAFAAFVARNSRDPPPSVTVVPEDNAAMTGSYAMVDPAGRFYDNTAGHHTYGDPILAVGIDRAWSGVRFDDAMFRRRGGVYRWDSD